MILGDADIHRAFEEDEFLPFFQPIVGLRTGQLAGFEVLARWQHGKLGMILPDEFIPRVEAGGLINQLTQVMLAKAFAAAPVLKGSLTLSVNLSPAQLLDLTLPGRIAAAAQKGGFPLGRLTIEITESALVEDLPRARRVVDEFKAMDCRLALDDFGTGYSSLKHLHTLPFDELKVDKGFVSSMTQARESRKIVAAILGLGHSLGVTTVAEGVESEEQANMLFWLGCDQGQGWLYGKPVPAHDLPRTILEVQGKHGVNMRTLLESSPVMSLEALPAQRLAQLQAIYDGAPVGLCFLDWNMRYVSLNRQLAKMNGIPAMAHLGRTPAEVVPLVFPRVAPFIRRALAGEPVNGVEVLKPGAGEGGKDQALLISYHPVRDEAGEVLGVSVAIMDITERKRMETELRESQAHYRHMMELNPHIPWVLNEKGECIEASRRWELLTGMPLKQAFGRGWLQALHPRDVAPTVEAIQATLQTGRPLDIEYRVRRPGEKWKWMRARGSVRVGSSGEVVRIYGSVEDIDAYKRARQRLLLRQIEMQAILDAAPAGMILAEAPDTKILMANAEAMRMFGGAIQPGQRSGDFSQWGALDADGRAIPPEAHPLARAVEHGETTAESEIRRNRSDGTQARLNWSAHPIQASDGQRIGGVMVVREMDAAD